MPDEAIPDTDSPPEEGAGEVNSAKDIAIRTAKRLLLFLALVHVGFQFFVWLPVNWRRTDVSRDTVIYYNAARAALHHRSPYHPPEQYNIMLGPVWYVYPPQFAAVLAPLAKLPFVTFARLWYIPVVLGFWAFAWALAKLSVCGKRPSFDGVLIWALVLGITPGLYFSMSIGQADLIVWGLLGLAVADDKRRLPLLAFAAQIKLYTLVPLLAILIRQRGRGWQAPTGILVAGAAIGLLIGGPSVYAIWMQTVHQFMQEGTFNGQNLSASVWILRFLRDHAWACTGPTLPWWGTVWLGVASVAGPAIAFVAARKVPDDKLCAIVALATVLFSPLCWNTYLFIVYLLVALAIRDWNVPRNPVRKD